MIFFYYAPYYGEFCGTLFVLLVVFMLVGWCFARQTDLRLHEKNGSLNRLHDVVAMADGTRRRLDERFMRQSLPCANCRVLPAHYFQKLVWPHFNLIRICPRFSEQRDLRRLSRSVLRSARSFDSSGATEILSRSRLYVDVCGMGFLLMIKMQVLITLFLALAVEFGHAGFLIASCLMREAGWHSMTEQAVTDVAVRTIQNTDGFPLGAYLYVFFAVGLSIVALIFLQKTVKLLIVQCDILLTIYRLANRLLFVEHITGERILQELTELTETIKRKNSSGFLNNFFDRVVN